MTRITFTSDSVPKCRKCKDIAGSNAEEMCLLLSVGQCRNNNAENLFLIIFSRYIELKQKIHFLRTTKLNSPNIITAAGNCAKISPFSLTCF
jgi:hypothetical protein